MAETESSEGGSSRAGAGGLWVNTPLSEHAQLQMTKALGPLKDTDTFVPPTASFLPLSFFSSPPFEINDGTPCCQVL